MLQREYSRTVQRLQVREMVCKGGSRCVWGVCTGGLVVCVVNTTIMTDISVVWYCTCLTTLSPLYTHSELSVQMPCGSM